MMPRRYASSHCVLVKKVFTTKRTKDTKDSENYYVSISYFVLFATFVVKMSVSILVAALRRCALRGE